MLSVFAPSADSLWIAGELTSWDHFIVSQGTAIYLPACWWRFTLGFTRWLRMLVTSKWSDQQEPPSSGCLRISLMSIWWMKIYRVSAWISGAPEMFCGFLHTWVLLASICDGMTMYAVSRWIVASNHFNLICQSYDVIGRLALSHNRPLYFGIWITHSQQIYCSTRQS